MTPKTTATNTTTITTKFASLHYIDRTTSSTTNREINTNDAISYVQQLTQETQDNPNKRAFAFKNTTTPISDYITDIFHQREDESIENIFNSNCIKIAERLLLAEQNSANKYPIMPPKKGSLIITADNRGLELLITFAKIDTADFLEDVQLQLRSGLPLDKKALKTVIISMTQHDEDEDVDIQITVSDNGSSIAKYWTDDFLEATELTSDEKNTKTAFNAIEKVISQTLKVQAPSDYTELRNNLVGYFKTQSDFQFEQMIDQVFGSYTMDNPNISFDNLKGKVNKLKESEKFDTHFTLKPNEIKARFKKTYKVSEEIELRTIGHIDGLRHIIKATTNSIGEKVLEIKVENDTIYKSFEFNSEANNE